jgi:septal ring factor EnvC (AmiA/AmiB activator)
LESTRDCLTKRLGEVEACLAGVSTERDQLAADAEVCSGELARAREEAEKLAQELATLAAEHSALVEQLKGAEEGSRRAEELAAELDRVKAEQAQVRKGCD